MLSPNKQLRIVGIAAIALGLCLAVVGVGCGVFVWAQGTRGTNYPEARGPIAAFVTTGGLITGLPTAVAGWFFRLDHRIALSCAIACGLAICVFAVSACTWDFDTPALAASSTLGAYVLALGIAMLVERRHVAGRAVLVSRPFAFVRGTFARPLVGMAVICVIISLVGFARRAAHAKAEQAAERRILEDCR